MKLKFSWVEHFGELDPTCESDTVNQEGVSLLSCLLTDTGGLPYPSTVPWLEEGLQRIHAVRIGEAQALRWGREDWGALLRRDDVRIYSLNDEDYAEIMDLDVFESAMRAWMDFLQTPPDAGATKVIDI